MQLKPITDHTVDSRAFYEGRLKELRDHNLNSISDIMSEEQHKLYTNFRGYAHYTAEGYLLPVEDIKAKLGRDLTELDIAMLVDGGFSWFGGYSTFFVSSRHFVVKIYTD